MSLIRTSLMAAQEWVGRELTQEEQAHVHLRTTLLRLLFQAFWGSYSTPKLQDTETVAGWSSQLGENVIKGFRDWLLGDIRMLPMRPSLIYNIAGSLAHHLTSFVKDEKVQIEWSNQLIQSRARSAAIREMFELLLPVTPLTPTEAEEKAAAVQAVDDKLRQEMSRVVDIDSLVEPSPEQICEAIVSFRNILVELLDHPELPVMMNEYGVTTKDLAQVIAVFRANPNKELGEVIGG